MKLLVVCPAATDTLAGTVRLVLLLESRTANPPSGAVPVSVTVHGVLPGVLIVRLVQLRPLKETDTGREIAPPTPLDVMGEPKPVVAITLVSWIGIGLLKGLAAIWNVTVATVPSAITLLFNPAMRQLFPEQERDFPALVRDASAATVTNVTSEEKLKDHWSPVAPPGGVTMLVDVSLMGSTIVPPGVPDPDPTDKATLCPKATVCKPSRTTVLRKILRATFVYRSP